MPKHVHFVCIASLSVRISPDTSMFIPKESPRGGCDTVFESTETGSVI